MGTARERETLRSSKTRRRAAWLRDWDGSCEDVAICAQFEGQRMARHKDGVGGLRMLTELIQTNARGP